MVQFHLNQCYFKNNRHVNKGPATLFGSLALCFVHSKEYSFIISPSLLCQGERSHFLISPVRHSKGELCIQKWKLTIRTALGSGNSCNGRSVRETALFDRPLLYVAKETLQVNDDIKLDKGEEHER